MTEESHKDLTDAQLVNNDKESEEVSDSKIDMDDEVKDEVKKETNNYEADSSEGLTNTDSDASQDEDESDLSEDVVINDELQTLKEENANLDDKVLRLQAEIANMKRVNLRDRQEAAKYRSQNLAKELLEGLDNLERALSIETESQDAKQVQKGVEMAHSQLIAAFERENIRIIDPLNQPFDPNFHQAVSIMPANNGEESQTVMQVLQKGYELNDRVIRPAMVIVAE